MFGNMHTIQEGLAESKQDIQSVQQQNQFIIKAPSQRNYIDEEQDKMRSH